MDVVEGFVGKNDEFEGDELSVQNPVVLGTVVVSRVVNGANGLRLVVKEGNFGVEVVVRFVEVNIKEVSVGGNVLDLHGALNLKRPTGSLD